MLLNLIVQYNINKLKKRLRTKTQRQREKYPKTYMQYIRSSITREYNFLNLSKFLDWFRKIFYLIQENLNIWSVSTQKFPKSKENLSCIKNLHFSVAELSIFLFLLLFFFFIVKDYMICNRHYLVFERFYWKWKWNTKKGDEVKKLIFMQDLVGKRCIKFILFHSFEKEFLKYYVLNSWFAFREIESEI